MEAALGRCQQLTIELLDPGFKPGQIQKPTIRGDLFHLGAADRAADLWSLGVNQFGRGRDHAQQLDVAGRSRCRLDSDQKVGGLKPFRLDMQNIFSRNQVANRVGARRTGGGVGGLSRYLVGDGQVSPTYRGAPWPGHSAGDIAGGGILGICQG
jgi:hypothetical protein